jgi:hypothetical protein
MPSSVHVAAVAAAEDPRNRHRNHRTVLADTIPE